MPTFDHVLLPGRHHCVTRFQGAYLPALLRGEATDSTGAPVRMAPGAEIIWAVTSASHVHTRRNPISGERRLGLIERFAAVEGIASRVVTIADVPHHPRFSSLVVTTAATELGVPLDPSNTVVACSTATVAAQYAALGYTIAPAEASYGPMAPCPWDVVELCAAGDPAWEAVAHHETVAYWKRYGCVETIRDLFADPVVSDEGDLTATRDYRTYAASFENASERKWAIVGPHLRAGRVVDIGCATGGLLEQVAADGRFFESDLFGIDVARPLVAEAEHKKEAGVFANPNIWFISANVLTAAVMAERSVDSTVTVALTHEICSYGAGRADLEVFARRIHDHTRVGGVWVNSDVLGPEDGDRLIRLHLATDDGDPLPAPYRDLDDLARDQVHDRVAALSTDALLVQFAHDFPRLSSSPWSARRERAGEWVLPLREAMEFLTRKDYHDNWLSECHERFCDLAYSDWVTVLTEAGFVLEPASGATRNDWVIEHRIAPVARMTELDATPVPWPDTHVLTVARRATHADPSLLEATGRPQM